MPLREDAIEIASQVGNVNNQDHRGVMSNSIGGQCDVEHLCGTHSAFDETWEACPGSVSCHPQ